MNPFEFLKNALTPKPPAALPENALLIDVRSPVEFAGGSIHGAINIPVNQIELIRAHKPKIEFNRPIVVFCASGMRSGLAKRQLQSLGYEQVLNGGGISTLAMQLAQTPRA
jgi:phage shock protein E